MADLADYARPFEQGIMAGAQIGHTIAQNQIAREKMRRDLEQAQISNAIQERHTRLLEADAALKAEQFQQLNDWAKGVTMPSGELFNAMPQENQDQANRVMGARALSTAPPALLFKSLEGEQSDAAKEQRLQEAIAAGQQKTDTIVGGQNLRNSQRMTSKEADRAASALRTQMRTDAADARATGRDEASMARARFVQGAIDARSAGRAKTELYPAGTPAALYDELLTAKAAGGQKGSVSGGTYVEGARQSLFSGPQPIDTIIESIVPNVPPATRRRIESKVKNQIEPDQPTPESTPAGEPAAIPVPNEPAAEEKVTVISPKGVRGKIPASQLDAALKQGYQRAK